MTDPMPYTRPGDAPEVPYAAGDHNPAMTHQTTTPPAKVIEPGEADEPQWAARS